MLKRKIELVVLRGETEEDTKADYRILELAGYRSYAEVNSTSDQDWDEVEEGILATLTTLDE